MTTMTHALAQAILSDGLARVRDQQLGAVCLSVCDAQGFLISFLRMDKAPLRSIEIAQRKAYSSVRVGSTTEAFHAKLRQADLEIGYYGDARLTAMAGGAVIRSGPDGILGGIGVSGLTPQEDQALADALATFAARQAG